MGCPLYQYDQLPHFKWLRDGDAEREKEPPHANAENIQKLLLCT